MTKIAKAKPKAKEAKEASATMTKIAKAKPKAKEAKELPAKKIQILDPKKEVRITRIECRKNPGASIKMLNWSSGRRPPTWFILNKSLLCVKKGSLRHKLAIRRELVRLPGKHNPWHDLYHRYALGWRKNIQWNM
jgi:hypothetical protein